MLFLRVAVARSHWSVFRHGPDRATWIVTVNIGRLAEELSPKDADRNVVPETRVEPSRLSRLIPELAWFGLIEMPELEWDPIEKYWMPRHIRLTDRFWQLCGVNMDKLLAQRNARIETEGECKAEAGTSMSVREVRHQWYERARINTLRHRHIRSVRGKRRKRLAPLRIDERRQAISSWLIRTLPNH
ncbi:plasmid replication initiator RepA [Pantoea phytobeneficialis]|uniref:Plasmid replication initiator RepA n=1 Tax=Pantoea phytobeneficialis TaxID=2052056 RepID=A0ABT8XSP6_9GAMM|nr:plasmid replication initiator RepA [Pantoea phytobeneficialis]MDO6406463.1 plasmid replication initiator RepA [Pantoea phytobeneficialis]